LGGDLVVLRELTIDDADALLEMRRRNQEFLRPLEPLRPNGFLSPASQRADLEWALRQRQAGLSYAFGIFEADTGALCGRIALSNIVRAAWQNCTVGYYVDEARNGRGYATEAVRLVTRFALGPAGLHRVQAGVMPRNTASIRVVEKNGFRFEGLARNYLQINGVWEDHNIYARTIEDATT
jgi:ribosomal-protein-alanine N-acetyltransferase